MKITAQMVKELREATGAGILDAKNALEAANGDFDQATAILREKGLKRVEKKSGRQANEGLIEMYAHPGNRVGVILEINCETDFVARNEAFQELAHNVALQIAAMNPRYVGQADVPTNDMEAEREMLTKLALAEGKPENIVAKIVDGRMRKFYEEYCLLDQPFVKDDSKTIQDMLNDSISTLGENIIVRRFQRYELGDAE
jgi:elongation factor Ts